MVNIQINEDELFLMLRKVRAYRFTNVLTYKMKMLCSFTFTFNKSRVATSNKILLNMGLVDKDYKPISEDFRLIKKITQKYRYLIRSETLIMMQEEVLYNYMYINKHGAIGVLVNDKEYKLCIATHDEISQFISQITKIPVDYYHPDPMKQVCIDNKILQKLILYTEENDIEKFNLLCEKHKLNTEDMKNVVYEMYHNGTNIVLSIFCNKSPCSKNLLKKKLLELL